MKLSFSAVMKIYSTFSILFFLFGALAIVFGGKPLIKTYELDIPSLSSTIYIFRLIVVVFFGAGFVISSFVFAISRRRGFIAYKRIIDRISSERSMSFNLNIKFPENDELGNLGKWLNKFIEKLREFDRIKVERLRAAQQKLNFLSESIEKGLVIVTGDNKISYANSHFKKLLNIGDKTIVGLPVSKVIENETLIKVLETLGDKPKNQVLEDLKIKVGDVIYKTKVTIVPIISTNVELMETMILFDYIQKRVLQI